jgi:hypothetical protein
LRQLSARHPAFHLTGLAIRIHNPLECFVF